MGFQFFKSPEGIKEYAKVGQSYPDHLMDQLYEHFKQLVDWDENKKENIIQINRIKRFDGSEWLVYQERYEGHDKVFGRRHSFTRSNLGMYMEIEKEIVRVPNEEVTSNPSMALEFDPDGKPKDDSKVSMFKEITNIVGQRTAYSIPFSAENLDRLREKIIDKNKAAAMGRPEGVTRFTVTEENGMTITVTGPYEHFRDASFDVLFEYGCIPTKAEKERIDSQRWRRLSGSGRDISN